MAKSPTNQQLAEKLDEFKLEMKSEMTELRKEMMTFRDFMIVQIDRQKRRKNDGTFDWGGIVKDLIVALGTALAVILTLLKAMGGK